MPQTIRDEWIRAWDIWDGVLEDLGIRSEAAWDLDALAAYLDVPGFAIGRLLPAAHAAGLLREFDLVGRVRRTIGNALFRLRGLGVVPDSGPLPLSWGATEMLCCLAALRSVDAGPGAAGVRAELRKLAGEIPEVRLCGETVDRYFVRAGAGEAEASGAADESGR